MKAIVIEQAGGPEVLKAIEVPAPVPSGREVLVKVAAFGVNRADLSQRRGHYPAPPGEPQDIPGLEFSGVIERLGDKCLGDFPVGSKVCGIVGGGAYAEYLTIHERLLLPVPASLTMTEAAAIPEVYLTAYDALFNQGELKAGEKILIHAVGSGVGSAATQIAKLFNCFVLGTSRTREKLELIKPYGIDVTIHSVVESFEKVVETETGGTGVDLIIDFLGGTALEANLRCLCPKGRLIFVGLLAGAEGTLNLGMVMKQRLTIRGTVLRSRPLEEKIALIQEFRKTMLPFFDSGKLKPIVTKTFGFAETAGVHQLMEENQTVGKVVVVV